MSSIPYAKDSTGNIVNLNDASKNVKYFCVDCGSPLLYKNGDKKRPYFSHRPGESCSGSSNSGGGEGDIHYEAKHKLIKFLNEGGEYILSTECSICSLEYESKISLEMFGAIKAIGEHRVENMIYDIALLDGEHNVKYIIEIKDSHSTKERPEPWCEINASTIYYQPLENGKVLKNDRTMKCDRQCMSMSEIAKQLGYLNFDIPISEILISSCCNWARPVKSEIIWQTEYDYEYNINKNNNHIWADFLRREKCLYCSGRHATEKFRPFCLNCWKDINNGKCDTDTEICLERSVLNHYKKEYKWLYNVPEISKEDKSKQKTPPCLICGMKRKTQWFYGPRQICINCINNGKTL